MKQPNLLLQAQEIQLPTFETCKKLKELGLLPPLNQNVHIYHNLCNSLQKAFGWFNRVSKYNFGDSLGELLFECFDSEMEIKDAIFAPDLGQLWHFIQKKRLVIHKIRSRQIIENQAEIFALALINAIEQGYFND